MCNFVSIKITIVIIVIIIYINISTIIKFIQRLHEIIEGSIL